MAKVPDTPENMARCICGGCPSYPGGTNFFCAKGKSPKEVRKRGCLCPGCQNYKDYGLDAYYYCTEGAAQ